MQHQNGSRIACFAQKPSNTRNLLASDIARMPLIRHELKVAPPPRRTRRRTAAEIILLSNGDSFVSEMRDGKTEIVVAIAPDDRNVLQTQIPHIQKCDVE